MMSKYYKHPKFRHVYGQTLATPVGRIYWPSLVTPKAPPPPKPGEQPGSARFEVSIGFDKADSRLLVFKTQLKEMTDEMVALFNEDRKSTLGSCSLLLDGDEYIAGAADRAEKYPYYKGRMVLTARNAKEIPDKHVLDRQNNQIPRSTFAGGMECKLVVTPMCTAHGISYKLEVVQLWNDDGTRYGGGGRNPLELLAACEDAEPDVAVAALNATEVSVIVKGIDAAGKAVTETITQPAPATGQKGLKAAIAKL